MKIKKNKLLTTCLEVDPHGNMLDPEGLKGRQPMIPVYLGVPADPLRPDPVGYAEIKKIEDPETAGKVMADLFLDPDKIPPDKMDGFLGRYDFTIGYQADALRGKKKIKWLKDHKIPRAIALMVKTIRINVRIWSGHFYPRVTRHALDQALGRKDENHG